MHYRAVIYQLGRILIFSSCFYLFPILVGVIYGEYDCLWTFVVSAILSLLIGFLFIKLVGKRGKVRTKEGLVVVGLAWIAVSVIGALPLFLSHAVPSYTDAVFEMVSGFTTTGATILTDFEIGRSLHFWRIFSHWLGGMGILVFMIALVPSRETEGFQMIKFESTGPQVGKLVSKIRYSAFILYAIYFFFSVLEVVFLLFGGLNFFDAILLSMSTAGTGGFTSTAASVQVFNSLYVEIIVTVFMFIFSVNFNLYYLLLLKKGLQVFFDDEFRFFLFYVLTAILLITVNLTISYPTYNGNFFTSLRYASFTVLSICSTSGFVSADFALWPLFSQIVLLLIMFLGAMAGSTGGGFKATRALILLKSARGDTMKILRPNEVYSVKMNKKPVSSELVAVVRNYFFLCVSLIVFSTTFIALQKGVDILTAFTAVLTCFSNVGPGLGSVVGPTGSFASFSVLNKWLLSLNMLLGRLEIFPILLLFHPKTWSKRY